VVGLAFYGLWRVRDRGLAQAPDEQTESAGHTVVVRSGRHDANAAGAVNVSTPLVRAAERQAISLMKRRARRVCRASLLVALVLCCGVVAGVVLAPHLISLWWLVAVPAVLAAWLVLARSTAVLVARHTGQMLAQLNDGNDDQTRLIAAPAVTTTPAPKASRARHEMSVDLSKPVAGASVSQPLTVAPSTYVSKPVLPRSVRNVDLTSSSPDSRFPVTANDHQDALPFEVDLPRAVGE